MTAMRILYHVIRADFLERVRSYGFLALLLFTVFLTYLFIPDIYAVQIAGLNLGGHRAVYNSAWIGSMTTLLMGEFFLLFAFYLIKGSVERDRTTGIGQILAATPMSKVMYTLGKWLSNVAVAITMTLAIIVAAALLQLLRAEDTHINLWALASPFLIVLFPALTIIAATAILFDCVSVLRGGIGNVVFFFLVYPLITLTFDLQGNTILYPSIYRACAAQFADCNPLRQIDAGMLPLANFSAFHYDGIEWIPSIVVSRLALLLVSMFLALLAAWFFDRFVSNPKGFSLRLMRQRSPRSKNSELDDQQIRPLGSPPERLTPLAPASRIDSFSLLASMFVAELRLTFKGTRWLWTLAALCILAALTFVPLEIAHLYLLPLAFVLPLTVWSNLGIREVRNHTEQIIFSTPHPLTRHLPITWLTGVFIGFILTSPVILRLALAGEWRAFCGLWIGIFFVPTLAMTLGCWSSQSKLFEGSYLFLWYIASLYNVPALDFMGRVPAALEIGIPWLYAWLTILLGLAAIAARQRHMKQ